MITLCHCKKHIRILENLNQMPSNIDEVKDEIIEEQLEEEIASYLCESNKSTVMIHNTAHNLDTPTVINVLAELIICHETLLVPPDQLLYDSNDENKPNPDNAKKNYRQSNEKIPRFFLFSLKNGHFYLFFCLKFGH